MNHCATRLWTVGLTGGIGAGKSIVAERFVALGAALIDTDQIAHQLTVAGGAAIPALRAAFGPQALTEHGALNRAAMRARIFADPAVRARLEAILHPMIRAEVARQQRAFAHGPAPYVLLAIPLLVETGHWREHCDRILVIDCPPATQIARVMQRSGLSQAEVAAILNAQASRAQRLAVADDVIDNQGDPADLAPQVAALHQRYLSLSGRTE